MRARIAHGDWALRTKVSEPDAVVQGIRTTRVTLDKAIKSRYGGGVEFCRAHRNVCLAPEEMARRTLRSVIIIESNTIQLADTMATMTTSTLAHFFRAFERRIGEAVNTSSRTCTTRISPVLPRYHA